MYKLTLKDLPLPTTEYYYDSIRELMDDINNILLLNVPFINNSSEIIISWEEGF